MSKPLVKIKYTGKKKLSKEAKQWLKEVNIMMNKHVQSEEFTNELARRLAFQMLYGHVKN